MVKLEKAKPLVSVILPTYNRAHLLSKAIESVLSQTFKDFELIIVDDGSTDNTEKLVKTFKDKRVIYIKHEKNRGAPAARNTGIKNSRGKYISFIDSDDIWFPEKLEMQVKAFEKLSEEYGVVFSSFYFIENDKKSLLPKTFPEKDFNSIMEKINIVNMSAALIKRRCIENTGFFDERFPRLQDWEFFFRISRKFKFKFLNKPLVIVTVHKDGISSNNLYLMEGLYLFIQKYKNELNKKSLASLHRRLGIVKFLYENRNAGRRELVKSLTYNPFDVKSFVVLFSTFLGKKFFRKLFENT